MSWPTRAPLAPAPPRAAGRSELAGLATAGEQRSALRGAALPTEALAGSRGAGWIRHFTGQLLQRKVSVAGSRFRASSRVAFACEGGGCGSSGRSLSVYGLHGDGVQVILAIGPMSEHVHPEYTAELRLEFDF